MGPPQGRQEAPLKPTRPPGELNPGQQRAQGAPHPPPGREFKPCSRLGRTGGVGHTGGHVGSRVGVSQPCEGPGGSLLTSETSRPSPPPWIRTPAPFPAAGGCSGLAMPSTRLRRPCRWPSSRGIVPRSIFPLSLGFFFFPFSRQEAIPCSGAQVLLGGCPVSFHPMQ